MKTFQHSHDGSGFWPLAQLGWRERGEGDKWRDSSRFVLIAIDHCASVSRLMGMKLLVLGLATFMATQRADCRYCLKRRWRLRPRQRFCCHWTTSEPYNNACLVRPLYCVRWDRA